MKIFGMILHACLVFKGSLKTPTERIGSWSMLIMKMTSSLSGMTPGSKFLLLFPSLFSLVHPCHGVSLTCSISDDLKILTCREFVSCVKSIKILSSAEVQQMSLDGDLGCIPKTQACSASDDANAWRA